MRAALVALLLVGCTKSNTKQCGVITCGPDTVCSPNNDRCVTQTQLDACESAANGDGCSVPGISAGVCTEGVCLGAGCGNGIRETSSDEVCDDGNLISGDGCRADCKSLEVCGDGVLDFNAPMPETCDCGTDPNNLPLGCSEVNSDARTASCLSNCQAARCGDGVLAITEVCDDGNNLPGDGCRADCQGRWTQMQSTTLTTLADVDAVSATNAWAVGGRKILRWNGLEWTAIDTPPGTSNASFTDVLMLAADDILVIAFDSGTETFSAYRHTGGQWAGSAVHPGTPNGATWKALGTNGTSTVIVGNYNSNAYLGTWNGSAFNNASSIWIGADPRTVAVSPGGKKFLTTEGGVFLVEGASSWTFVADRSGLHVSAPSDTSFWLFDNGASYHSTTGAATASAWTLLSNSSELQILSGADASANIGLAVGPMGAAILCSPSSCEISPTGSIAHLFAVKVIDDTHAFIVGSGGTILY